MTYDNYYCKWRVYGVKTKGSLLQEMNSFSIKRLQQSVKKARITKYQQKHDKLNG